jgi:hypothetical protein
LGVEGDAQCVSEGDEGLSGEGYQKGEQYRVYNCDGEDWGGGKEQIQSTSETENFIMTKSELTALRAASFTDHEKSIKMFISHVHEHFPKKILVAKSGITGYDLAINMIISSQMYVNLCTFGY